MSSPSPPPPARRYAIPPRFVRAVDIAIPLALTVVGALIRQRGLPTDGLWFDDSWVAAGGVLATPSNILITGSAHPGLTALLAALHQVSPTLEALALPALVAGSLAAPVLFLFARHLGYPRAVATTVAAMMVAAPIHVIYSGRIKGYTLDTLWVLVLAYVVCRLATRSWSWKVGAAWVGVAWVAGTFSGYVLVATAAAGIILLLHPRDDWKLRVGAVSVQAAGQLGYYLALRGRTDLAGIEKNMDGYDGHMDLHLNPVDFVNELLEHLHRIGEVYPGRLSALLTAAMVFGLVGLVLAAVGPRSQAEAVTGRFMLLLIVLAIVGSMVGAFPFGTTNSNRISLGGRHSLWLIGAFAVGMAAGMDRLWRWAASYEPLRHAANLAMVAVSVVLVGAGLGLSPEYPAAQSEQATAFVEQSLGPGDLAVITSNSVFSFAALTEYGVTVVATPHHQVGFAPVYDEASVENVGGWSVYDHARPELIRELTAPVDRVFVVGGGWTGRGAMDQVTEVLTAQGFTLESQHQFELDTVEVWTRQ